MERVNLQPICTAIFDAPAWALIGVTMPDERMRVRAAHELATVIARRLNAGADQVDPAQLRLPI